MNDQSLEQRLQRLEDQAEIRDLLARYAFTVDDRDIDGMAVLFARDARFRSADGVMDARGREAVMEQFHGRFAVLGPSNHVTHDHLLRFDAADDNRAYGRVSSHAEVVRNGRTMITALRYDDTYVREDDGWVFADRVLSFMYYVPAIEYAEALESDLRMRVYDEPAAADWPENLPSWRAYYPD